MFGLGLSVRRHRCKDGGGFRTALDQDRPGDGLNAGNTPLAVSFDGEAHLVSILSTDSAPKARVPGRIHRAKGPMRCLVEPGATQHFRHEALPHSDPPGPDFEVSTVFSAHVRFRDVTHGGIGLGWDKHGGLARYASMEHVQPNGPGLSRSVAHSGI